ncbi:MAG: GNAT family N-acetyltransferase [Thermoplasmata archaeon]
MKIRRMTEGDFSFAVALTDGEEWGYVEEDFERLLSYEPEGCFIAEAENQPVGLTTTTSYGPVGWIGNVVIDKRFRGTGVGTHLVRTSMEYLLSSGVRTIQLTSYMNTIQFYAKLGFQSEFPVSCMSIGTKDFDLLDCRMAKETDLDTIAELDAAYFGGNRTRVIRRMWRDFPRLVLLPMEGLGYVIATCTEKSCEVGPLVVESGNPEVAGQLLKGILGAVLAEEARMFIPHANASALELTKSLGFREEFRTMRMRYGEVNRAERAEGIYAMGALEKG